MNVLSGWNAAPALEAESALLAACASPIWARALTLRRPYSTVEALLADAEAAWFELPAGQWLTAFAAHPRIGESKANAPGTLAFTASSTSEQAVVQATLSPFAQRLAQANREYEQRFGFLYIVFANQRTAPELLAILEERLRGDPESELLEASRQQWLITRHRLEKWLSSQ